MNLFKGTNKEKLLKSITPIQRTLIPKEALFHEDDECSSIAIILSGSIKAIKHFQDGHEKVIRYLHKNEIIGISLIFSSRALYKASFYADEEANVLIIAKDDLLTLINHDKVIMTNILEIISDSSIKLNDELRLLSYKTIRERICYLLYKEYEKNNKLEFTLNMTKTDMASIINVERPSLSLEIKKLIAEGIIENQNKYYKICDLNKLFKEL